MFYNRNFIIDNLKDYKKHTEHDDVIKWRDWPFVRGIHRSPVNSPHKDQWRETFMFSFDRRLE